MKRCLPLAAIICIASARAAEPRAIGVGAPPPRDAVVLFGGSSTAAWENPWKVEKGAMTVRGGNTQTREKFGDAFLHVEFRTPDMPEAKGQAKGNSGVFLQGSYEVQVLDSYGIADPGKGDCGAIYNISAPLVAASRPAMEWQAFDIVFRAPRFDAEGKKTENARITVFHNGVVVQNNVEVPHNTANGPQQKETSVGPVMLQDHGNPVAYRNIWLVPLPLSGADHY